VWHLAIAVAAAVALAYERDADMVSIVAIGRAVEGRS
jgi:hypothetical protein